MNPVGRGLGPPPTHHGVGAELLTRESALGTEGANSSVIHFEETPLTRPSSQPAPDGVRSRLGAWTIPVAPEVSTRIRSALALGGPPRPVKSQIGADRVSRVPFARTGNA